MYLPPNVNEILLKQFVLITINSCYNKLFFFLAKFNLHLGICNKMPILIYKWQENSKNVHKCSSSQC